jgi:hypothetical protein
MTFQLPKVVSCDSRNAACTSQSLESNNPFTVARRSIALKLKLRNVVQQLPGCNLWRPNHGKYLNKL